MWGPASGGPRNNPVTNARQDRGVRRHMKPLLTATIAILLSLAPAVSLVAHHSLGNHDTSKAVRVKGTIVQIHLINPHSIIYIEEKIADGSPRRWAVEGPGMFNLNRQGRDKILKPGDEIEVCGYVPK